MRVKGFIDYTEFVSAAADFEMHDERVKEAFSLLDSDGNGFIELEELKEVLIPVTHADDEAWRELVKEMDTDGDGKISFEEFKTALIQHGSREVSRRPSLSEPKPRKQVMTQSQYNLRRRK